MGETFDEMENDIFAVSGIVTYSDDTPVESVLVQAIDQDLRDHSELGEHESDKTGRYVIQYRRNQLVCPQRGNPSLRMQVVSKQGEMLFTTRDEDIHFNAPLEATIDIQIPLPDRSTPPLFTRVSEAIQPVLKCAKLDTAGAVREDGDYRDITFLAGATGIIPIRIVNLAVAHRLHAFDLEVTPEFYYGLLEERTLLQASLESAEGLPRLVIDLDTVPLKSVIYDIVLMPDDTIKEAIKVAVARNTIGPDVLKETENYLKKLSGLKPEATKYKESKTSSAIRSQVEDALKTGQAELIADALSRDARGSLVDVLSNLQKGLSASAKHAGGQDVYGADQPPTSLSAALPLDFGATAMKACNVEHERDLLWVEPDELLRRLADISGPEDGGISRIKPSEFACYLERTYPTTAFYASLERDKEAFPESRDVLLSTFKCHPNISLRTVRVEELFPRNGAREYDKKFSAARKTFATFQRLSRVCPKYSHVKALINGRIFSATKMRFAGQEKVAKILQDEDPDLTQKEVKTIVDRANTISVATSLQAGHLVSVTGAMRIAALRPENLDLSKLADEFPNLKTLFQTGDFCACRECRTVHSPAAYVADTLHFLTEVRVVDSDPTPGSPARSAKEVLFDRRPDLGDLDLSCENTNITLPYIDIVCELLEEAIAPDPGMPFSGPISTGRVSEALLAALTAAGLPFTPDAKVYDASADDPSPHNLVVRDKNAVARLFPTDTNSWSIFLLKQTYESQDQVEAMPQYINQRAFETLAIAPYAFSLPFVLSHEECLLYFRQFDVSRAELMQAMQIAARGPTDLEIGAEILGISPGEVQLIATGTPNSQDTYWGADPSSSAVEEMSVVENFVNRTGMAYADLQNLLTSTWVNPSSTLFIQHKDNTCNLANKTISGLTNESLDRFHRFIRLLLRTSIPATTLDRLINASKLGNGLLNGDFLVVLSKLFQLRIRLKMDLDQLSYVFSTLSTEGDFDSPYNLVFLNKSANGIVDEAFTTANLAANEDLANNPVPGVEPKRMSEYQAYLALCLGISAEHTTSVVSWLGRDSILSLKNVSAVYALVKIAGAIKMTIPDMLALAEIAAAEPLSSPSSLLSFVGVADFFRALGTITTDLQYYLQHTAANLDTLDLNEGVISQVLQSLLSKYTESAIQFPSPYNDGATPEVNEGAVVEMLSKLPTLLPTDIVLLKAMFSGVPWRDSTQTATEFVAAKLGEPTQTIINAYNALVAAPPDNNGSERNTLLKAVADRLRESLVTLAKNSALEATITTELGLATDIVPALLQYAKLIMPTTLQDTPLNDILTADSLRPPGPGVNDSQVRALQLIHMMGKFISANKLRAETVKWMLINNATLGWMRLDRLKYRNDVYSVPFKSWEGFQKIRFIIDRYPAVDNSADPTSPFSIYTFFERVRDSADLSDTLHYYSQLTGADEILLTDLCTHFGFQDTSVFREAESWERLDFAIGILRKLGITVTQASSVISASLSVDDATAMRLALKARYEDSDWLKVLKPLQNSLRRKKRDALVNYIIAAKPLPVKMRTAEDLYDYFLIDVEMGSCMDTSRIVQAHATIQLFANRCLLGLEKHAIANTAVDTKWARWEKSMSNYRLWEISKKVFLFPHAYLDQGARQDKSEIFENFEKSLNQNQLTDSAITSAFAGYLQQLQAIEHVDVLTCYYQADILAMHVFAKSRGPDPPIYYHRLFIQERWWTPWETLNVDITGDNLLAFDRNTRLTLAWPIFTEEIDPAQRDQGPPIPAEGGHATDPVRKRWRVQLAVSELVDGTWTAKKVSREGLYCVDSSGPTSPTYIPAQELERKFPQKSFLIFPYSGTQLGQGINVLAGAEKHQVFIGTFALTGCSGYPEATRIQNPEPPVMHPEFEDMVYHTGKFWKRFPSESNVTHLGMRWIGHTQGFMHILDRAASKFTISHPLQLTLVDTITAILVLYFTRASRFTHYTSVEGRRNFYQFGAFMPFFYGDSDRSYTIIPGWYNDGQEGLGLDAAEGMRKTYSDIYALAELGYNLFMKWIPIYQADPERDLQKLLQQVREDAEFKRFLEEFESFRKLTFKFRLRSFHHPLVCALRKAFNENGIPGLFDRSLQLIKPSFDFSTYAPTAVVHPDYPAEDLDFDSEEAYAGYNWELFFHSVYEVSRRLNQDQRFGQAQAFSHHIFNPLGAGGDPVPQRYWVTKPFQLRSQSEYIDQLIASILGKIASDPLGSSLGDLRGAVNDWMNNPFDPWAIAKHRTVEYQIATVLAYVKNLIDWGDSLFRQFTRESVTQATQLYILAHKLLGPKPRVVAPAVETPIQSYNELEAKLDNTGNALLDLENMVPDLNDLPYGGAELPPLSYTSLYFCVPLDDHLLSYWNLVEDRLTKIRTCRNIDGAEAHLSLFSPPVDFAALGKVLASGSDVADFLKGLGAPLPIYRFTVVAGKAVELAAFASFLGRDMLLALEKRDAESMARLHSVDRKKLLQAVRKVKEDSIVETQSAIDGLALTKATTQVRYDWYSTQPFMNLAEWVAQGLSGASLLTTTAIAVGYSMSGGLMLIPSFIAGASGFGGTPHVVIEAGGKQAGDAAEMGVRTMEAIATGLDKAAGMATVQASYQRREAEWDREKNIANAELADIQGRIDTAKLHKELLENELKAHDQDIANNEAENTFLHSKYTNKELYEWMVRQTSQTYLSAYKLAFDMAKKAERCYQIELASDATFVSYGFDTLKKGLTAAELLQSSVHAMQTAYFDNNKREYELSKNVSMRLLDPQALLALKSTGKCTFRIPEAIFDLDYPGHYMRRHKNVSITIPCITGPFNSVCCKLSLLNNRYRRTTDLIPTAASPREAYDEIRPGGDSRFMYNVGPVQSVATSTCQEDSGIFEVSFRDERYLPFEGTGAIATWHLELPVVFPQFDLDSINDVIFHIRYTAREGGSTLADAVRAIQLEELNEMVSATKEKGLFQAYAMPQVFPASWNQLLTSPDNQAVLKLMTASLPFYTRKHGPTIDKLVLFLALDVPNEPARLPAQVKVAINNAAPTSLTPDPSGVKGRFSGTYSRALVALDTEFTLKLVDFDESQVTLVTDMVILVHYTLTK